MYFYFIILCPYTGTLKKPMNMRNGTKNSFVIFCDFCRKIEIAKGKGLDFCKFNIVDKKQAIYNTNIPCRLGFHDRHLLTKVENILFLDFRLCSDIISPKAML